MQGRKCRRVRLVPGAQAGSSRLDKDHRTFTLEYCATEFSQIRILDLAGSIPKSPTVPDLTGATSFQLRWRESRGLIRRRCCTVGNGRVIIEYQLGPYSGREKLEKSHVVTWPAPHGNVGFVVVFRLVKNAD